MCVFAHMLKSLTLTRRSCCCVRAVIVGSAALVYFTEPTVPSFSSLSVLTVFYCSPLFWRSALIDRNSTVTLLMFFKPTLFTLPLCALFKETVVFLKPLIYIHSVAGFQWVLLPKTAAFIGL